MARPINTQKRQRQREQRLQRLAHEEATRAERQAERHQTQLRNLGAQRRVREEFGWNANLASAFETLHLLQEAQARDRIDLTDRPGDSNAVRRRKQLRRDNQTGGGIGTLPQFQVQRTSSSEERLSRFGSTLYRATFDVTHNFHQVDLLRTAEHVDELFRRFVADKIAKGCPDDFIVVNIHHKDLSQDINVCSRIKNFNVAEFANRIFKTSQSAGEWLATGKFMVEAIVSREQQGSGFVGRRSRAPQSVAQTISRKRCIVTISNPTGHEHSHACGYLAIVTGRAHWQFAKEGLRYEWKNFRSNHGNRQVEAAKAFCMSAGLDYMRPLGSDTYGLAASALAPEYQLIVLNGSTTRYEKVYESSNQCPRQIYLFLIDSHYHLVTNLSALFQVTFFCRHCWVGWKNEGRHICSFSCSSCRQPGICEPSDGDEVIVCQLCARSFQGRACFEKHQLHSICRHYRKCNVCEKEFGTRHPHKCGKTYCERCKLHDDAGHQCYITQKSAESIAKEDARLKVIVSFDIESELEPDDKGVFHHTANLLCAQILCDNCAVSTDICELCGPRRKTFKGYSCVKEFGDFLYGELAVRAEKLQGRVFVFAHNFQRYDGHFIFRDLFGRGFTNVEPVLCGLKLLKIDVGNIRFIDSLSFFQLPLSRLPVAFGYSEVTKSTFPHLFNTAANWLYVGAWPAKAFYGYDRMTVADKLKFDEWYVTVEHTVFNLQDELTKYCHIDVEILMNAVMCFRNLFSSITNIDPITRCFTLASVGLETYRVRCLRDNQTIGITPVAGYGTRKQSAIARAWLDWIELSQSVLLEREAIRGPYFADGAHNHIVYEFNGCWWHGCPRCIIEGVLPREAQLETRYNDWTAKVAYYNRQGFDLRVVWECDLRRMRESDPHLDSYITGRLVYWQRHVELRVDLRQSLVGGRTNNLKFYHEAKEGERIRYYDVTSEYPYVLKNFMYPVGHPRVINGEFDFTLESYFGFVKCSVLAPERMYLPLLPLKSGGKLKFVLCRTCSDECNQLGCTHTDNERQFTSTYTTVELQEALRLGYRITEIFEVYHYEERSSELFQGYINLWLRVKQEASGWPHGVATDEALQMRFIDLYYQREGITLDPTRMTKRNAGLRFIAKLMLNSFWGKLAQQANRPQTMFCSTQHDYFNLLRQQEDGQIRILGVKVVSPKVVLVSYQLVNDEHCQPGNTSVAIASFVTSYARLHLYRQLARVVSVHQDRLLYFDTDSIVFVEKQGETILELGDYLGDLTDELSEFPWGSYITRIVMAGPKNYGYEVMLPDGATRVVLKTKGIRVDSGVLEMLPIERITDLVTKYAQGIQETVMVRQHRFRTNPRNHEIYSADVFKVYRVVSEKRRVLGNDTLPFGWVDQFSPPLHYDK